MSWGLAFALGMAALVALAHAVRAALSGLYILEERILDGRGLSPSLLIAVHQQQGRG
jgi:hypothetical protein